MIDAKAFLAAIAVALAFGAAGASEHYHEKKINADSRETFVTVVDGVHAEMRDGGKYEFVTAQERRKIDKAFAEMLALFDKSDTVAGMTQVQKVKLFDDQEIVNSILTHRDRDRVICTHKAPVGSHIPVTSCHTYAQEVEAHEETRNQMDSWKRGPCIGKLCSNVPQPVVGAVGNGSH